MTKAPRVFDLPPVPPDPGEASRGPRVLESVAVEEQPDAFAAETLPPPRPTVRRGIGLAGIAFSALTGFFVLVASAWAWTIVTELIARNAVLGWTAAALASLGLLALLLWIGRELLAVARLARIERLRGRVEAALAARDAGAAAAITADLAALYADRPDTARGRARLADLADGIVDAGPRLEIAERELVGPLDRQARAIIAESARRVSLVTALSPRALVDILFVLAESTRLIRRIATLYGGRPGKLGMLRLFRAVLGHLAVTGGVALGDEALHQIVGQGLAARLSAKLGEGVLNGVLTARVGLSALLACRPMPFVALKPPGVREVAGALWAGQDEESAKTVKMP